MFTVPTKPFTYTAKGTARRQAIIREYEPEIAELYERYERDAAGLSTSMDLTPPTSWNDTEILAFVRIMVQTTLDREIPDTIDLFQCGLDR